MSCTWILRYSTCTFHFVFISNNQDDSSYFWPHFYIAERYAVYLTTCLQNIEMASSKLMKFIPVGETCFTLKDFYSVWLFNRLATFVWTYLMKAITETHCATWFWYLRFYCYGRYMIQYTIIYDWYLFSLDCRSC
jgi:hypothetical protein